MRSQRLALLLGLLLVLTFTVASALGARMAQLQRQIDDAAGQQQQLEQQQEKQRLDLQERERQLREVRRELSDTERSVRDLERQITGSEQVQQQIDELKAQLEQERQRANELQQQINNLESMNSINTQVTAERGLATGRKLPRKIMTRSAYRDYLNATLDEDFPAEEAHRQMAKLVALDMIEPGIDLRQAVIDGQADGVLGFYEPAEEQLYVISDRGQLGVEDRVTYAHEYTHYLQDQAFGLDRLMGSRRSTDEALALRALIEGDAVLSMEYWAEEHLSDMDKLNRELDRFNYLANAYLSGWGAGGVVVEDIGAFPYRYGATFVHSIYLSDNGWPGVNRAYQLPPRSTAQILHPELYFWGVEPVDVRLPDLAAWLGGGWSQADNDVLGELYLRVYIQYELDPRESRAAIEAADGWRGDRFQVLEGPDGARALAIRVLMADPGEAAELFDTYESYILEKSAGVASQLQAAGRRQWSLADRQVYLAQSGSEVLILHGNDVATLDRLKQAFPGF